jgi:hypothetical protein
VVVVGLDVLLEVDEDELDVVVVVVVGLDVLLEEELLEV